MPTWGTFGVDNLLASTNQSVIAYGEDATWQGIQSMLDSHNTLLAEKYGLFVDTTTDRQRRYGGPDTMTLGQIDEYGTPDAQTVSAGSNVGFPLRKFGRSLQWSYTYLEEHTPNDLVGQTQALMDADVRNLDTSIVRAFFTPTNLTFPDRLTDNVNLAVKALINADGAPIPPDPYGGSFDPNAHNHYLGTSSFATADLAGLVDTVVEHQATGRVLVMINKAQENTVRGFTGFTAYPAQDIVTATSTTIARGTLNPNLAYNRAIGVYGNSSAEVWVKPFIPAGYAMAILVGGEKPLVMRIRNERTAQLRLVFENELHPLRARTMEREFGIGVWNRNLAAVLDCTHSTYNDPGI